MHYALQKGTFCTPKPMLLSDKSITFASQVYLFYKTKQPLYNHFTIRVLRTALRISQVLSIISVVKYFHNNNFSIPFRGYSLTQLLT